jgi:hypothetical protein
MRKLLICSILLCSVFFINRIVAQIITTSLVHDGTTTVFYGYNSFIDAYTASVNGDQLYLSPGGFGSTTIAKRLTIIGAGHAPDSSDVIKRTFINGGINLDGGSDSSYIEGLYINGGVDFLSNDSINYVKINRCYINGAVYFEATSEINAKNNITIDECIIEWYINGYGFGTGHIIKHNIILGVANVYGTRNSIFDFPNNVLIDGNVFISNNNPWWETWRILYNVDNSLFQNNIYINTMAGFGLENACENTGFYNNLTPQGEYTSSINSVANNYFSVPRDSIFKNQSGTSFNYTHDYHLKHPETYFRNDTTNEVGLFGGRIPFKEDFRPSNPQVKYKSIAKQTDTDGNLQIKYTVESQEY